MMNVIGLGHAGCQIAKNFEKYDQYRVFCVDVENKGYNTFIPVKEQISHEDYEKNYKKLNLAKCKGPTTLILNGIGNISGCALRLLEQIRENPIEIIYIKSDESSFTDDLKKRGRTTLGFLQEYTRSAVFEVMYIISNEKIEEIVEEISLKNYWQDINNIISSTYHMLNVFRNTEALLTVQPEIKKTARIRTFGVVNFDTNKEKLFYDLQFPRTKRYFYGINEEFLDSDKDLLHKTRKFVQEQADQNIDTGFSIYSTNYEHNYIYTVHCASYVQEQKID